MKRYTFKQRLFAHNSYRRTVRWTLLISLMAVSLLLLWMGLSMWVHMQFINETADPAMEKAFEFLANPEVIPGAATILLALLALMIPWELENYKKASEQRQRRDIEYQEISRLLDSSPIDAIESILKAEEAQDQSHKDWSLRTWRQLRDNEDFERRALQQLNQDLEGKKSIDGPDMRRSLESLERFYADVDIGKDLKNCMNGDVGQMDRRIKSALSLWRRHDEDVRNIVIRTIQAVDGQPDGRSLLERWFEEATDNELRLLRDRRPGMELADIARERITYRYEWRDWAPLWPDTGRQPDRAMQNWLRLAELAFHPFPSPKVAEDPLLQGNWANPENWDRIKSEKPLIICSDVGYDRVATATMLCHELRMSVADKSFPILIRVPSPALAPDPTAMEALQGIAISAGGGWIGLLSRHPWALLELDRVQEAALAQFLTWTCGSPELLKRRLQRAFENLPDTVKKDVSLAARDMLIRRLDVFQSNHLPQWPSTSQLSEWISLRPPGISRSYVIAYCDEDERADRREFQQQAKVILDWAWHLAGQQVALKLFAPAAAPSQEVDSLDLVWAEQALVQALDQRVKRAGPQAWAALFDPIIISPQVFGERLVEVAGGSYGRMVRLAHDTIQVHVNRAPTDVYLRSADQADALAANS